MPPLFAEAWHPTSIWEALLASALFGLVGIVLVVFGFKVFDRLTPGNLQEEVVQKNNIAAAILAGTFIIGICYIIGRVVGGDSASP